ncbi:type 4a pilus biogenesis protein PilO [Candidatus Poribacteria bacterium]|nr:type 4a pilus biogenesis protein PilO [Candidatus Poribacteria bacterium]
MELFKDRVITKIDWIIIGASLFFLLIVTLVYFLALSYGKGQTTQAEAQIVAAQARVTEARAIAAKRDILLKQLTQVKERITAFETRLPTEKEIPKLLDQFQQIAELSGVKYRLITAEPMDEKELFVRIPFKVKVDGAYPEIGVFLRSLEYSNRFIKVEDMDIGPQEKDGRSEANFVVSTFMFMTKEKQGESGVTES